MLCRYSIDSSVVVIFLTLILIIFFPQPPPYYHPRLLNSLNNAFFEKSVENGLLEVTSVDLAKLCAHSTPFRNHNSIQKETIYPSHVVDGWEENHRPGAYHMPLDPDYVDPFSGAPVVAPLMRLNDGMRTLYFVSYGTYMYVFLLPILFLSFSIHCRRSIGTYQ